jgi:hypothetical protein
MSAPMETRQACTDCGREHAWEPRVPRGQGGLLIFACKTWGAWGWAMRNQPGPVRAYRNAFADPFKRARMRAEPNVLTREERNPNVWHETVRWIDRRGDHLPRKKGAYTPRYVLDDWDHMPTGGGR